MKEDGAVAAGPEFPPAAEVPAMDGIGEDQGQDGYLGIDCKAEGAVEELFHRFFRFVESAFGEYSDVAFISELAPHQAHALCAAFGAAAVDEDGELLVDKTEEGDFDHIFFGEGAEVFGNGCVNIYCVEIGDVVGDDDEFFVLGECARDLDGHADNPEPAAGPILDDCCDDSSSLGCITKADDQEQWESQNNTGNEGCQYENSVWYLEYLPDHV